MAATGSGTAEIDTNIDILEVKELSGSDDPPYDFPIPGISLSLVSINIYPVGEQTILSNINQVAVDPNNYVERLKGLSFESDEDEDVVESWTPLRVREELEVQNWAPHVPGHFPTYTYCL